MLFVIDLDSLYVIEAARDRRPVSAVSGKRGDGLPFEVMFVRSGIAGELTAGTVLTFGCKQSGKYDSTAVVLHSDFILTGSGETALYTGSPSFNTAELNALLFVGDDDDSNDPEHVDLMAEFTWQVGDGAPTSTKTFRFRVHNDVIRDGEITPAALAPVWSAPLVLTAPPVNSDYTASVLAVAFTGANNNLLFTQLDAGDRIFLRIYEPEGFFSPPPIATWNPTTRTLEVTINAGVTTADDLVAAITAEEAAAFSVVASEGDGAGVVEALALTGFTGGTAGTAATAKGQLAIVTTTNDSGTFEDVWTCSKTSPVTWQPPGNIYRDRTTGTLYRVFYNSAAPDTEEAYP